MRPAISSDEGFVPSQEEAAQELAGCRVVPPVRADRVDQVAAELGRPDPGAKVVGRVEAGVHVGEVGVRAVADAGRGGEPLLVTLGASAGLGEPRPERELESQLRLVAAEEHRLEERGRLGVLSGLLVGEAEVACVPLGLAGDRLDDVGVDLGERVVAREAAERDRERRIDAGEVQRVAGLVQERLVVVQPALGTRDQVDDATAGRSRSRRRGATSAGGRRDRA